jgi:dipeptidyl-peptidase-4
MLLDRFKLKGVAIAVISSALLLGACDQNPNNKGAGNKGGETQTIENPLTPDIIYASGAFASKRFGQVRWLADNTGFTQTEASTTLVGGDDLVQYDPNGANRKVLISTEQLVPTGAEKALTIKDYAWSDDGSKVLIFTNTKRVWRRETIGDYWVLDQSTGQLTQTGQQFEASTQMFAKFSPDGSKLAYVQRDGSVHNLFVEDVATSKVTQITKSGTDTVINATFDWAYEEEFGLRDGFRWSPDSSKIAYWQLDSEGVKYFTLINNTDTLYPTLKTFPYPKVGETSSAARMGVVSAEGGATTWMQVPGDQRNNYVVFLEWAANSDEVVIQQLNRRQNTNNLYMASAADGSVKTVLTDTDEAWLNPVRDFMWLDGGNEFLWMSEEGGMAPNVSHFPRWQNQNQYYTGFL